MGVCECIGHLLLDSLTGGLWGLLRGMSKSCEMCGDGNCTGGCCKLLVTLGSGGVEDIVCDALTDGECDECYNEC
jgi:hypothetical protein